MHCSLGARRLWKSVSRPEFIKYLKKCKIEEKEIPRAVCNESVVEAEDYWKQLHKIRINRTECAY